ncbi:glycine--tRNA ligase, chloroplastic/mitochondrial 2 isoform X2 [Nicotiana tabacum]|uniref:glycine--tRNA ligase n=4 Tax=Nicotiana TaxID=4085 RepID=A0A1S4BRE8_TOBAC|nr:PREDICTED: glycine--tRNA ligase 2, chloroplastic/mitochondrial isoform X2 [Nicotiana sylvestris]XP_016491460.1 PREDICTED: glycine--tRNA ligase, chloroplastic/mitochondrial 2 isoform X2 [Nicotiana tabacum]
MAILALPLVTSILKPHKTHFSFLLTTTKPLPIIFHRRFLSKSSTVSALSTSSSSTSSVSHNTEHQKKPSVPTFQQAIQRLQEYWGSVGCAVMQCSNTEVGAGTMNPLTYLRVLGPEPWNVAYVEPSIRPDDSRYGENPNRLQRHTQFQVILKPDPGNSQDLFIRSLSALGIDVNAHDIRFVEDNWESPVLGAWGLGWEVWMDGMEITQFTYFQQAGSIQLMPVSVEITYGLERILMSLQGVDHFKKIQYADGITYGELFLENEKEMSAYYLEHASVDHIQKHFDLFEAEARRLLDLGLAIPAYDQLLKTSHAFNVLDSRGFVGVTERARYFGRMRSLARQCAHLWLKTRESLDHPLGVVSQCDHLLVQREVLEEAARKVPSEPRLLVLEIGTEELPPNDVSSACKQLKDLVVQLLDKQRLPHGEVQTHGTPRRLVVSVEELFPKQVENEVEVRGPPVSKAFDKEGNPTKAAEGFCRRNNVPLDSMYRRAEGKTEYVYARLVEPARLAFEVLSEELPVIISSISFPKSMRWNSDVAFSRPIRWILALHGDVVLPFIYAGVVSGNVSHGLRNTPSATVKILDAETYANVMQDAGILVDVKQRKKTIMEQSNDLAKSIHGHIVMKNDLLDEVVNLVEAPLPVLGEFDDSFLELPKELLIMVMQKHQRYFAMTDENGKLLPYFITVANGSIDDKVVRKGNEAVLRARFEDAKFFYEMDTSRKFSEFRPQLKGILFHEKLGTMLDKMSRVQNLVSEVGLSLGIGEDKLKVIQDAASLANADLATAVVTEFTSLSGTMGRHYALRDGYSEEIAEALFEISLPRFSGDMLPKTEVGAVLAITDRLDSLVGLFAAGCQPSSSNDPFGLRRISYGLVQLLVESNKNIDLRQALDLAAAIQPIEVDVRTINDVQQFVSRRLEQFLMDKGISPEVVRSVLSERASQPCLATKSVYKMESLSKGELLPKVVEAYSRPTRIVRGKDANVDAEVDDQAFETNEEKALWSTFLSLRSKTHPDMEVDDFVEASSVLIEPLEDFFNEVFVMVEDERIRTNRLALLKKIADLPRGIVDFSVLPGF